MSRQYLRGLLTAALIFFTAAVFAQEKTEEGYYNIDPKTMQVMLAEEGGIILDVRTPKEVKKGIIPGAKMIDWYDEDFVKKAQRMDPQKKIFVYCKVGSRSAEASAKLVKSGYFKVYNLEGGIQAWKKEKYPIDKPEKEDEEEQKQK